MALKYRLCLKPKMDGQSSYPLKCRYFRHIPDISSVLTKPMDWNGVHLKFCLSIGLSVPLMPFRNAGPKRSAARVGLRIARLAKWRGSSKQTWMVFYVFVHVYIYIYIPSFKNHIPAWKAPLWYWIYLFWVLCGEGLKLGEKDGKRTSKNPQNVRVSWYPPSWTLT